MNQGIIFDVKELTLHDGPGIRTTIFFKGCPLRCVWCHNPEGIRIYPQLLITQNGCTGCHKCFEPCIHEECKGLGRCVHKCPHGLIKIAGTYITARELAERMHRMSHMLVDGGVTISGGEPMLQPDFILELLELLRPLHTIVETSGYASPDMFRRVADSCSIVYLDIKHANSGIHKHMTGVDNQPILENLRWLKEQDKPFVVRIPLIPDCNDDEENLQNTAELLVGSSSLTGVELLPFNPFSKSKYSLIGEPFRLEHQPVAMEQKKRKMTLHKFLSKEESLVKFYDKLSACL